MMDLCQRGRQESSYHSRRTLKTCETQRRKFSKSSIRTGGFRIREREILHPWRRCAGIRGTFFTLSAWTTARQLQMPHPIEALRIQKPRRGDEHPAEQTD